MADPYITPEQGNTYSNEFFKLHATFARPIFIFQTAKGITIASNPDHNYLFDSAPTNDVETMVIQSGTFMARIKYEPKQPLLTFAPGAGGGTSQISIRQSDGAVRIKLDQTGCAFLAGAQRVEFDGNIFEIDTQDKPHSLLASEKYPPKFQDFYLKSIQ